MNNKGYVSLFILLNFVLTIISGWFIIFQLPASTLTGTVSWKEYDESAGKPDAGAKIYIFSGNRLIQQIFADYNGSFKSEALVPDKYTVYIVSANVRRNVLEDSKTADDLRRKLKPHHEIDIYDITYSLAYKVREVSTDLPPLSRRVLDTDFGTSHYTSHLESDILRYDLEHPIQRNETGVR